MSHAGTMPLPTSIIGFDSAWTDSAKAPGAIAIIRIAADGGYSFVPPKLARFDDALALIEAERAFSQKLFVAIDQPTIVPNLIGSRPADNVAASLISFVGGGVQPANRSKRGMFDDTAAIWRFKAALGASEVLEPSRLDSAGTYLAEVFPAMALLSFNSEFCTRLGGPRYNPSRRKTFRQEHWIAVVQCLARVSQQMGVSDIVETLALFLSDQRPTKADQDRLDAIICALIGLTWLKSSRESSVIIGDERAGQILVPAAGEARRRLFAAATARGVPIF